MRRLLIGALCALFVLAGSPAAAKELPSFSDYLDAVVETKHNNYGELYVVKALDEIERDAKRRWLDWKADVERHEEHLATQEAAKSATESSAPVATFEAGSRCGGDLPPCSVMLCESGGNIRAQNSTSSASGKWQFIDSTWAYFGGYARAYLAPEHVQDAKARLLWAGGAGASHWQECL